MGNLSPETTKLAQRLADAQGVPVEEAIRRAIVESARAAGVDIGPQGPRRRLSVDEMLSVGEEIAALPLRDRRTAREIMDELNTP